MGNGRAANALELFLAGEGAKLVHIMRTTVVVCKACSVSTEKGLVQSNTPADETLVVALGEMNILESSVSNKVLVMGQSGGDESLAGFLISGFPVVFGFMGDNEYLLQPRSPTGGDMGQKKAEVSVVFMVVVLQREGKRIDKVAYIVDPIIPVGKVRAI